jgi:hypothetical protein
LKFQKPTTRILELALIGLTEIANCMPYFTHFKWRFLRAHKILGKVYNWINYKGLYRSWYG